MVALDSALALATYRFKNVVVNEDVRYHVGHRRVPWWVRHNVARGRYERSEIAAIREALDPRLPVLEMGGGIGVVSAEIQRRLRPARHVVVEYDAAMARLLEATRDANGFAYDVVNAAVAYGTDRVPAAHGAEFISQSWDRGTGDDATVPAVTLRKLLRKVTAWGDTVNVVMDVEGAERDVFEHDADVLRDHVRGLVVEYHPGVYGGLETTRLDRRVQDLGFACVWAGSDVRAYRKA